MATTPAPTLHNLPFLSEISEESIEKYEQLRRKYWATIRLWSPATYSDNLPGLVQSKRHCFPDGSVIFIVRKVVYRVHRHWMRLHMPVFFGIIETVPKDDQQEFLRLHGSLLVNIIEILDVTVREMDLIMGIFYPRSLNPFNTIIGLGAYKVDDWITVLRLSVKWAISDVVSLAQIKLENLLPPLDKLVLALEHPDDLRLWLKRSYIDISLRPEPLTPAEADRLPLEAVYLIAEVKQRVASGELYPGVGVNQFVDYLIDPSRGPPPPKTTGPPMTRKEERIFLLNFDGHRISLDAPTADKVGDLAAFLEVLHAQRYNTAIFTVPLDAAEDGAIIKALLQWASGLPTSRKGSRPPGSILCMVQALCSRAIAESAFAPTAVRMLQILKRDISPRAEDDKKSVLKKNLRGSEMVAEIIDYVIKHTLLSCVLYSATRPEVSYSALLLDDEDESLLDADEFEQRCRSSDAFIGQLLEGGLVSTERVCEWLRPERPTRSNVPQLRAHATAAAAYERLVTLGPFLDKPGDSAALDDLLRDHEEMASSKIDTDYFQKIRELRERKWVVCPDLDWDV
ncbi:hypothetical protein K488DRAFT_71321 [Vararia minispora EC-137]|uniref:Uncharacterized protein n=1 Tax=Vararia minispora EC-137 TaxID=1314806 RepID=A0ACB8QII8_9AGAM|nr:hypothetical protein K488DRAFT_71321 [Vararia minispora EC-137]